MTQTRRVDEKAVCKIKGGFMQKKTKGAPEKTETQGEARTSSVP